ncbi:class II aldolase/adducin family protein [Polynucleobacter sp. Adler-ghost]|uniref:class II aldolase/adducin family protein n=1 Tax=Polynucleobacter sp. Adler-ghost TaxID=2770234 RepID=UPI001BFE095E|nr:class II aldolase/adducin family protein [Polynucleobacter sp. Adler-ghost]QWE29865.1 class II aldolase/adducin family protein [Polynucleobacter sp. Adler-ghost]
MTDESNPKHSKSLHSHKVLGEKKFKHRNETEEEVRSNLAAAYRLAAIKGWDDGIYTHISASIPGEEGAYLINQFGLRFDEVLPENLVKVNLQGDIISGQGPVNQSGFAIHGAVHAARPDAAFVLHLHVDSVIAISAQKSGLLPISQHALRFYGDIERHRYQGLALSASEQVALISALGDKKALLLENHGSIICGVSIQQAFYLMDVLDKACKIQLLAGGVEGLITPDPVICRMTYEQLCSDGDEEGQMEWPAYLGLLNQ